MKPVYVKSNSYTEYNVDSNEKDPKFKVGDNVRIWKHKFFLLKDLLWIGLKKKSLLLAELKIQFHGHM